MFNKIYEKRFENWEQKERAKLGDKAFLEKNIVKKNNQTSMLKRLVVLPIGCFFVAAVAMLVLYLTQDKESYQLVMAICFFVFIFPLSARCYFYYTHHFKYREQKIEKWKEELKKI